eukprot:COSAG04_NODE_331_length_16597_cov_7.054310_8_plen_996_part_00
MPKYSPHRPLGLEPAAEQIVPPQPAAEVAPLVDVEAAAPVDPMRRARDEVAESERLRRRWKAGAAGRKAPRRLTLTIQPVIGGEGAAFDVRDIAPDMLVGEVKQRVHDVQPLDEGVERATPDQQRLVAMDRGQLVLEDDTLPIGAYIDTGAAAGAAVTLHLAMQDAEAAAARRARRIEARAEDAAARAAAQARWEARKTKAKSAGKLSSGMGAALLVVYLAAGCGEDTCNGNGSCGGLIAQCTCDEGFAGEHCEMDALTECGCGDHGVQTGVDAIAAAFAQRPVLDSSDSSECPVTDHGRCVTSRNYPSSYESGDDCTITVSGSGTVSSEGSFSFRYSSALSIGGTEYTGTTGLSGVAVDEETEISWTAEEYDGSASTGFKLCVDTDVCAAGSCTCEGNWVGDLCDTECGCSGHGTQTGIEAARLAYTPASLTSSDSSSCPVVEGGRCVTSRDYPSRYRDNDACTITARGSGTVSSEGTFSTEWHDYRSSYDYLTVGARRYRYSSGPSGVSVADGAIITWQTDGSYTRAGFKLCIDGDGLDACAAGYCACEGNHIGEFCETECPIPDCGARGNFSTNSITAAREANSCSALSCTCTGNDIGRFCEAECGCSGHGVQTGITAARAAGSCSAGSCACEGNWAGEFCERSCGEHGTSDGHTCTCEGNWVGEFCDTECSCNGRGNQTNITAARAAGTCSAGSCGCEGNWAGEFCERSCGEHGTSDGHTCTCEGDWIGEFCDTECGCGEHGDQTGIAAARAANSCSAGTCSCEGNFIGDLCDTECGCSGHGTQTGIEAARLAYSPASLTSSDSSSCPVVEGGRCVTSRNYPSNYQSGDSCTITARGSGTVSSEGTFSTESCCDYLTIGGARYQGSLAPSGVIVADGASITWWTDGSVTSAGFQLCIDPVDACSAGSCTCEGNWIGEFCDTECGCGEHGNQTGIEAARAADSCSAGSCACDRYHRGDFCEIWYRPSYTLSGCPDPSFCGVFVSTRARLIHN